MSKRMRGCSEPLTEWRVVLKKAFEVIKHSRITEASRNR